MTPHHRALLALASAAARIPEGVPPPPDRYGRLILALALAWDAMTPDEREAALVEPDEPLDDLLAAHEATECPVYRDAVAGLIGRELVG